MGLAAKPLAKPVSKTLGAAPAATKQDLVTTATLLRGRVYFYKDQEFKIGEPSVVTKEVADFLEEQFQEVKDKDGELFEKPFFDVRRGVPRPAPKVEPKKSARRLAARD